MVQKRQLREFRPEVRYRNLEITFDSIQAAISEKAEEFGIPVAFYPDDVGKDSFLNFNIADEPCLVMYYPDHKDDYFKFCIRISRSGAYTFVSMNDFGQSPQMKKAGVVDACRASRKGRGVSYKVGSIIKEGLTSLSLDRGSAEAEQRYYQCIIDILDELIA